VTTSFLEHLRVAPLALVGAGVGAAAAVLAGLFVPRPPRLHADVFHMVRSDAEPLTVSADGRIALPYLFGDCDLVAEVELPEHGELDIVFRAVEPTLRDGDMPLYHGRFSVLRLSAWREGPAFLSRERALFEMPSSGGVRLAPGLPATVHLQARGHLSRANVAGQWLPWVESVDAFGSFAFVARGPTPAVIRYLHIQPVPRDDGIHPPWILAGVGATLGLLFGLFGVGLLRGIAALASLPAGGVLGGALLLAHLLPDASPTPAGFLAVAACGVPLALALGIRFHPLSALLGLAALAGVLEIAARTERVRLAPLEDPRLSACLGFGSGAAPLDVYSNRLHARMAVHTTRPAERRILFCGGGPIYEAGGPRQPELNLGPLLAAAVGRLVLGPVDGVVVPTTYACALQQVTMLDRWLAPAFAPDLVVFAVNATELEPTDDLPPRRVLAGDVPPPELWGSVLLRVWAASHRAPAPPSRDLGEVRQVLDDLAALAVRREFRVALLDPGGLPPDLAAVLREVGEARGWPVLSARPEAPVLEQVPGLAVELARLLRSGGGR
jgi:hypothetical protein